MSLIKRFLGAIAGSKKAVATVAGVLFTLVVRPLAGWAGLDITEEQTAYVLGTLAVYVLGQGWSDAGKEAAQITAASITPIKKPAAVK